MAALGPASPAWAGRRHGPGGLRSPAGAHRLLGNSLLKQARWRRPVRSKSLEALLAGARREGLATGEVASIWARLSGCADGGLVEEPEVRQTLLQLAESLEGRDLDELGPRELADILQAWGALRFRVPGPLEAVCANAQKRVVEFDAQALAQALGGLGRLGFTHEGLLEAACGQLAARPHDFKARDLAAAIYALGRLRFRRTWALRAVCEHATGCVSDFSPQEFSDLVYGLWLLQYKHKGLLGAACQHTPGEFADFKPRGLAAAVYALS